MYNKKCTLRRINKTYRAMHKRRKNKLKQIEKIHRECIKRKIIDWIAEGIND